MKVPETHGYLCEQGYVLHEKRHLWNPFTQRDEGGCPCEPTPLISRAETVAWLKDAGFRYDSGVKHVTPEGQACRVLADALERGR